LKSGWRKRQSDLKKPPRINLPAVTPEKCYCGAPGSVTYQQLAYLSLITAAEGRRKFACRAEEVGLERCRNTAPNVIGPDGHIQQRIDLLCADDNAAQERTKQLADGHAIDLWHGDRFIATFKAEQQKKSVGTEHKR